MPMIPLWLRIVGPIVILLALGLAIAAYGSSKYSAGKRAGVEQTDAKWQAASEQLKKDAAKSATRADDAAAKRLEIYVEQQKADEEKLNEAQRTGSSPLDALFGG